MRSGQKRIGEACRVGQGGGGRWSGWGGWVARCNKVAKLVLVLMNSWVKIVTQIHHRSFQSGRC